jgi:single-strand DNA-binding protein
MEMFMSRTRNTVELIGYVGYEPELTNTESGAVFCSFPLATHSFFLSEGAYKRQTQWHRVVAWKQLGRRCLEEIRSGDLIRIRGSLRYTTWMDEFEIQHRTARIYLEELYPLEKREGSDEIDESPVMAENQIYSENQYQVRGYQ